MKNISYLEKIETLMDNKFIAIHCLGQSVNCHSD